MASYTNTAGVTYALTPITGLGGTITAYGVVITYPSEGGSTVTINNVPAANVMTTSGGTFDIVSALIGGTYVIPPGVTGTIDIAIALATLYPSTVYVGGTATIASNISALSGMTVHVDGGTVTAAGGDVLGALSNLTIDLDNGGTFSNGLAVIGVLNGTTINFGSNGGTFIVNGGGTAINISGLTINGFSNAKDYLEFQNLPAPMSYYSITGPSGAQVITLYSSNGMVLGTVGVAGTNFATGTVYQGQSGPLTVAENGTTVLIDPGASVLTCFLANTRIATPAGEALVEDLRAGDLVNTANGVKPVRWIGQSHVSARFTDPLRTLPVRIMAGALGDGLPVRDLLVSPDHAMFIGGILAHAGALVNGVSIIRETVMPETFIYYHIELATHELLFAEGALVESFVDNVDRMHFHNWDARDTPTESIQEMTYPRAKGYRQLPDAVRKLFEITKAA
jgi:hypothetical protein